MPNPQQDILVSPQRTPAQEIGQAPVVVIGLPRSGSSFLSHVLSQFPDYYVFDDLYVLKQAKKIRASNPLTEKDLEKLTFFLGWQIRARLRFGKYAIPNVQEDEVEVMDAALRQAFKDAPGSVFDLQQEWLHRLALRGGASQWGFKMPRAFLELDALRAHHPGLKVIFLMREPHSVLASYKHMPKTSQDGDPDRYHPLYYAAYWRLAARHAKRRMKDEPETTLFIKFHDLVKNTEDVAQSIAAFLDQPAPEVIDRPSNPNTSHDKKKPRATITGLESAIVALFCGGLAEELGFERHRSPFKIGDIPDFFAVSWRFMKFHLRRS